MSTNTQTAAFAATVEKILTSPDDLLAPVGVTNGEPLVVDLRRSPNVLLAGFAGSGKSTLLRLIAGALELQVGRTGSVVFTEGIGVGMDEAITEVHDELLCRERERTPNEERGPVALCIDDFGVWSEHSPSPESLAMLRRIALTGRGHDVHLVLATQSVTGISTDLLTAMSTRIVLGRVGTEYRRLLSESEWPGVVEAADRVGSGALGEGVLVDAEGQPTAFAPLDPTGESFAAAAATVRLRPTRNAR